MTRGARDEHEHRSQRACPPATKHGEAMLFPGDQWVNQQSDKPTTMRTASAQYDERDLRVKRFNHFGEPDATGFPFS
jgi:hypothetical protein